MALYTDRAGGVQSSLAFKAPVYLATTANITLSGFQEIDGVTPSETDSNLRILVKDQADPRTNGVYDMAAGLWQRSRDFDGNNDFVKGTRLYVHGGATQSGAYVVSTDDPIVLGTSDVDFIATLSVDVNFSSLTGFSSNAIVAAYNSDPASGWFSSYDGKAAHKLTLTTSEVLPGLENGGWRSAVAIQLHDTDTTDYEALNYRVIYDGARIECFGPLAFGTYAATYKDYHAITCTAIGRVEWDDRGCSGIVSAAIQYGQGICSNEFYVGNPAAAPTQSKSMAAIQGTVDGRKADSDATHKARGCIVGNAGKRATSAFECYSVPDVGAGYSATYEYMLYAAAAIVDTAAIRMPASAIGNVGTRIVYDSGDFTEYDRSANTYAWAFGGTGALFLNSGDLYSSLVTAKLANGTAGDPTYGFLSDAGNGMYLASADTIGWSINSVSEMQLDASALFPATSDGSALGKSGNRWADVFLASGAVINGAGTLNFNGASAYAYDAPISVSMSSSSAVPLSLISTNADANAGPVCVFERISASPAVSDTIGSFQFWGRNSSAGAVAYGFINSAIADATAGSEDGLFLLYAAVAGATTLEATFGGGLRVGSASGGSMGTGTANATSYYAAGTKVVGARDTGWTAMTNTANKATAYDTTTITLPQLASRVKSIQDALTTHGLLGT